MWRYPKIGKKMEVKRDDEDEEAIENLLVLVEKCCKWEGDEKDIVERRDEQDIVKLTQGLREGVSLHVPKYVE